MYDMAFPILAIIFNMTGLAIVFFLGQRIHTNMMSIADGLSQTMWYKCPLKVQRIILLMIMRSQQPFYLTAYGVVDLTLQNFLVVSE